MKIISRLEHARNLQGGGVQFLLLSAKLDKKVGQDFPRHNNITFTFMINLIKKVLKLEFSKDFPPFVLQEE